MHTVPDFCADRLTVVLDNAFICNDIAGFNPSVFDVDAYLNEFGLNPEPGHKMRGFDGYDIIELTERRSPAANWGGIDPANDDSDREDYEHDPFNSDAEADADVLANAGWGTDEDYGYYGDE